MPQEGYGNGRNGIEETKVGQGNHDECPCTFCWSVQAGDLAHRERQEVAKGQDGRRHLRRPWGRKWH